MTTRKHLVALLALVSVLTGACAASGTQRSTGQVVDDTVITARAKAALIDDPVTKAGQIDVGVNNGVVELGGRVDTQEARNRAAAVVRNLQGVTEVRNNLLVGTPSRSAGEVVDDTSITARVKAALVANEATKARQINVETSQGVVQLHGFVDSQQEASEAVRTARTVPGVADVRNDLEVKSRQ